jgi:hypothetical protein
VLLLSSGFKPFVDACIEAGENGEALKYIVKLPNPQEKADVSVCENLFSLINIFVIPFNAFHYAVWLGLFRHTNASVFIMKLLRLNLKEITTNFWVD